MVLDSRKVPRIKLDWKHKGSFDGVCLETVSAVLEANAPSSAQSEIVVADDECELDLLELARAERETRCCLSDDARAHLLKAASMARANDSDVQKAMEDAYKGLVGYKVGRACCPWKSQFYAFVRSTSELPA